MGINTEKRGSVLWIVLNRPEVYNSFNRPMALQMQEALDLAREDSVRAVVITGMGKAFCAGQDLKEVVDPEGPALEAIVREHYNPIVNKIRLLEKPVIAAVNGVAAGAGANLALNCDLVIAAQSASFIQAFSKIGLIPDSGGTWILPRLVGFARAMALIMTGEKVMAEKAEQMGMIYRCVEDEQFMEEVSQLAQRLAEMPTRGLWLSKQALNRSFDNDIHEQLDLEHALQNEAGHTHDYQEGVAAFLEKRKPVFKGV
jgi:2-(1,2-epoxy-1,2-dihydrophenyl)acetyl-CoA isomerase